MMTILEQEFYETVMHSIRDLANNLGEVAKEIREYEISRNNTLNEISGYLKVISEETKKQTRMAEQMSAGYQINCGGVTHRSSDLHTGERRIPYVAKLSVYRS